MKENAILILSSLVEEGEIKEVRIRNTNPNFVITEICDKKGMIASTAIRHQENSVRYAIAAILEYLGYPTEDATEAKNKGSLTGFGSLP